MSETNPNDDLIARYRGAFDPAPPAIDERALWYEAGRAAATRPRGGWLLPAYSGAMTALAASLGWALLVPLEAETNVAPVAAPPTIVATPAPVEAIAVESNDPAPSPPLTPWAKLFPVTNVGTNTYAARQQRMLREDFDDDLGPPLSGADDFEPAPPATRERLLEEFLPNRDLPIPPRPADGRQNTQQTRRGVKELA